VNEIRFPPGAYLISPARGGEISDRSVRPFIHLPPVVDERPHTGAAAALRVYPRGEAPFAEAGARARARAHHNAPQGMQA